MGTECVEEPKGLDNVEIAEVRLYLGTFDNSEILDIQDEMIERNAID